MASGNNASTVSADEKHIQFAKIYTSFIGFVILLILLLRPEPSNLLPNRPPSSRKVSVILFPTLGTESEQRVLDDVMAVIKRYGLVPELLCVGASPFAEPLRKRGLHVELLEPKDDFASAVMGAFSKAHYSLLLVLSELSEGVAEVVPKLIDPVVAGQSDLTVALSERTRPTFLVSALAFPLTHSRAAVGNSSIFCFHRAVWLKGCRSVTPNPPSVTLELLAKCSVHYPTAVTNELVGGQLSTNRVFFQVLTLYWQLHPVISVLVATCVASVFAFVLFVLCARTFGSGVPLQSRVV